MSATYDRLAELPITIESYELSGHDREFGDFTRPVDRRPPARRRPGGHRRGRRLRRPRPHRPPRRRAGATTSAAPATLGEALRAGSASSTCSRARRPEREASRHYRRWAYEIGGARPRAAPERDPALGGRRARPAAAALRLLDPALELRRRRQARRPSRSASASPSYPDLRVQARPRERLGRGADRRDRRARPRPGARPQGPSTRGTPVDVETDPELYRAVAEAFPDAYLEDPDVNDETREVLEPPRRPGHLGRAAALARRRQGARAARRRSTRSRRDSARCEELLADLRALRRERHRDLRRRPGRARGAAAARSSTWPRCFTPTPRTTSRRPATTTRRCPTGCRPARWTRSPSETGFRWAE